MKVLLILALAVSLGSIAYADDYVPTALDENGGYYATDRLVITLKPGVEPLLMGQTAAGRVFTGNSRIDLLCAENGVKQVEPFYAAKVRNELLRSLVERLYIFRLNDGVDAADVYRNFAACSDVEASDLYVIPVPCYTPNDPSIGQQWALPKVRAFQAWDVVRGDSTRRAVISINDTGVYWNHPDLAANIWVNPGEDINHNGIFDAADNNGIDDDNNSYVDDVVGWDLGQNDNNPNEISPTHGTHVAGCAAEVADNGIGGAGLGYSARIQCVKITNAAGQLTMGYQGMIYAADNGAHIINLSWGSPSYTSYGQSVCNYTFNAGVLNVGAAGNDDYWTPPYNNYPSAYSGVTAVAATDPSDRKTSFSNYNYWVDLSAPGSAIYSTWATSSYSTESGTSMSSPIVAGLAALLKAQNPSWGPIEIEERMMATAVNIDSLNPSYAGRLGAGRIDAYAALAAGRYPYIVLVNHTESLTSDDGDGVVNPGESIAITITLLNYWADGHDVTAKLRGPAGITIHDSLSHFGTFPGDTTQITNDQDRFGLTFDQTIIPGQYDLTLVVTSSDPYYTEIVFPVRVTLEKAGFPLSIPDAIESSPLIFDINGDGVNELIFGANDQKLYVIEPNGGNLSGWPVEVADDISGGAAVGDIDGDGAFEIVAAARNGDIHAWEANGSPLTGFPVTTGGSIYAVPVLGDLDANGDLEIIATNFTNKQIHILNHDGTAFRNWPYTGVQGFYGAVALGDFNDDDSLEIVVGDFDNKVHMFNINKVELSGWPVTVNGRVWGAPVIGNVEYSDENPEIAVATFAGSVYLLNHDGSVVSGWPVSAGTNLRNTPTLADIGGDGHPEVLIGGGNSNLYVFNSNGTSAAGFPVTVVAPFRNSPVVGDISGDGHPDIIAAVGSSTTLIYGFNRQGQLLRNFPMPTGTVGIVVSTPAIWDFDRDGDMEIVVAVQSTGANLDVIDYKVPISLVDIEWPFYGNDVYRSGNYLPFITDVADDGGHLPQRFALNQNYPNPFNSRTVISFNLAEPEVVGLEIYDPLGRLVRAYRNEFREAGLHSVAWDGRDADGRTVSSGIYFYRLKAGDKSECRRMMLLK